MWIAIDPIAAIAAKAGIPDEALEPYGKYKAKIGLDFVAQQAPRRLAAGLEALAQPGHRHLHLGQGLQRGPQAGHGRGDDGQVMGRREPVEGPGRGIGHLH